MTTLDRVWLMPCVELRAHALAHDIRGPMELTAMVEAVADAIAADESRAVPRGRRWVREGEVERG
jgi:hypothetical protein